MEFRQISFADVESYCEEIESDAPDIEEQTVRCEIEPEPVNNGIRRIVLRSGYLIGMAFRELALDCGTSPTHRGERDAMELANEVAAKIAETCGKHGLRVRRGIYR